MAITITANNANGDGSGIDVAAYLADFDTTFVRNGFGYFSPSQTDFSGNQYVTTEQANLLPNTTKQSVVFESGGGGKSIDYTFATHTVGGDLDAISFGYGMTYDSATDSFPLTLLDLRISGLGFVDQFGDGNMVSALITDAMAGNITTLIGLFAANEIVFVGSTGADIFTGYSHNDTIDGGDGNDTLGGAGGNDTLTGGAGNDTFVYDGQGADIITDFNGGPGVGDVIRVTGVYTTFAEIQANTTLVNGGADTQIDFGGGNMLTLAGFNGTLDANDFVFGEAAIGPEVAVSGNGFDIADGDTTPDDADGTDFGTNLINAVVERTFTVTNTGSTDLKLSALKFPKGFKLAPGEKLDSIIAPGQSDTFKVVLDTKKVGDYSGVISFKTNDPDEGTFDFAVSASVVEPEIDVLGNGLSIKDGSKKAVITNHTLFDAGIGLGDAPAVRTFTITNAAGGADLTISSAMLVGTGFTLLTDLTNTVLAGGQSVTFDVAIDTTIAGTRSATIQINNNDANEALYDFVVTGTVGPRNVVGDDALNDVFVATADPERFVGLNGTDTVSYANGTGPVVASLLPAGAKKNAGFAAGDLYDSIENLIGSAFNDTLTGDNGDNVLEGGAGADKLDGGKGIDTASYANAAGGVRADLLKAANNLGEAQGDTYKNIENLLGSSFNDTLAGDAKVNTLNGGDGDDTLIGNGGIDTLTGGLGADTFVFNAIKDGGGATKVIGVNPPPTGDLITDFESGVDSIGILRSGFKIGTSVDDATFLAEYFVSEVGVAPTTANQSGVTATATDHGQFLFNQATDQLWWDPDGAGKQAAVLLATFTNGAHLTAMDFDLL